jgi:hypothetical protein
MSEILELSVLHLNSTNSRVRAKFSHLLSLVPWYFTISRLTDANCAVEVKVSNVHILHTFKFIKS